MSEPERIWVRSIKHHTYWNIPRQVDTYYQVDNAQDADTLEALKFAVKEAPPAKAKRATQTTAPATPAPPAQTPAPAPAEATPAAPVKPAAIMTTADLPKPRTVAQKFNEDVQRQP